MVGMLGQSLAVGAAPNAPWVLGGVLLGIGSVLLPPLWRLTRTLVTVVHELGHALVGVLVGRRFTGLVVNTDMSGHTVTSGRPRGVGLVLTTAAGYPMPLLVGAGLVAASGAGRSGVVLLVAFIAFVVALLKSRSVHTVVVMALLAVGTGLLWWSGWVDAVAGAVVAVGVLLMAGGWRQLVNVAVHGDRRQDPGLLAHMTRVPAPVWILVWTLIGAGATWWVAATFLVDSCRNVLRALGVLG